MVDMRTAAAIPNARAIGAAVGDVEPTSAMPATQQAGEQPVPAAGPERPSRARRAVCWTA